MSKPTPPTYKTTNWTACNAALTIWFDPEMNRDAKPSGKRGRSQTFSDAAIQTCLTMKGEGRPENSPVVRFQPGTGRAPGRFGMVDIVAPLVRATMSTRQTTGFVESLLRLTGLDWAVPDFSPICRRQRTLAVNIPYRGAKGPLHLRIDSTGIKVDGEGEWTEEGQQTVRGTVCPTKAQAWRPQNGALAIVLGPMADKARGARSTSVARQAHGTFAERGYR